MSGDDGLAATVRDLRAREEIRELRARYCWHASRGDFEGIVGIFTPDGVFEIPADGQRVRLTGQEAIGQFLAKRMVPAMVFPMIHNDIITVVGDRAHGTCVMETRPADGPGFSGYYHDEARLLDGHWRFTERRFYLYTPTFERSGLDLDGHPESGLAAIHDRKLG